MASSAPSSPHSSRGGSPAPLLTPRSKIKALLATIDSSDDEAASPTVKKTKKSPAHTIRPASSGDDSESDVPVRPRGKLASRMQAAAQPAEEGDARERVRKLLERESEEKDTRETADADDEEEEPIVPRRLQRRVREATPENDTNSSNSAPASPGLFVESPEKRPHSQHLESDSEDELPATKSDRFKALVERKRQERLAREATEEARQADRRERQEQLASEMDQFGSEDDRITDDEGGIKLTQENRPARKASKRAIEEMNRETQRMARSMQLAHEAKTRKKISKASLFEKFNFRPAGQAAPELPPHENSSSRPSTPSSDVEMGESGTPPTSPPSATKSKEHTEQVVQQEQAPVTDLEVNDASTAEQKGKGIATEAEQNKEPRRVRVRMPYSLKTFSNDSDDELQITTSTKDKIDAIFNSVPHKKSEHTNSLQVLHALTHMTSPDRKRRGKDQGMSAGELVANLQRKAREQAKKERERRLETLKAQGVVIETVEERERQMEEVENMVAKAREEAERLMEKEREEAKQQKKENAAADPLAWDDSDEDYEDSANEADGEVSAIELSGSEDEVEDDEEEENEEKDDGANDETTDTVDVAAMESEEEAGPRVKRRRVRNAVLSDDEDAPVEATPRPKATQVSPMVNDSPAAPGSVFRSAKKTFIPGLPVHGPAGLGLTQIFAGTMDSQISPSGPTQSMMPDFDQLPDSNFSATAENEIVEDSQRNDTQEATQAIRLNTSQSQMRGLDSLMRDYPSQTSQTIELSQDGGLREYTPLRDRFIEPPFSTVETIANDEQASPLVRRRLRQRIATVVEEEGEEETQQPTAEESAFAVMKDLAKQEEKRRLAEEFDRKKSKAKEMVEEQAQESEDEYAGLGGADGEDSDSDAASVQDMIDDAAGNEDTGKLAAFYADRERADDEKAVEKLFKDITTGMLRRKRGADYDLDDSDDDGEARRRMKRRQFAKMQKALFSDERVKKMAQDPGNQAFLRTIEDHGSDEEVDLLVVDEPESQSSESTSQEAQVVPDSQPKPLTATQNRAPARMRRTAGGKKPSNIGEVRETLSNLLEEPQGSIIPATEAGSDSEDENPRNDKENRSPNRRVVDRISLKRTSSSISVGGRVAFAASSSTAFKVPMLLRRATTNSSLMSSTSTSSGETGGAGGFGEENKIKKTAGKRSGVVSRVKEIEGQAKIQESERRREERKIRGAERRRGVVGGLLGRGSFA